MRYLDLIRERRDSDRKPDQSIVDMASQRGAFDSKAFREKTPPVPLKVDEQIVFDMNANLFQRKVAGGQDFYSVGSKLTYRSPLFGLLEAEVLVDRGAALWIWHPIRECEACIPRSWVEGA